MIFTRIRSYDTDVNFTSCEHLYLGDNKCDAIRRFRKDYPEHSSCILIAERYDSEDLQNKEHFEACMRCGCVD